MEALDSIEKIIKYCKNPPDNFNIKMEELRAFNSMKEKIKRLNRESEQQVTLDSFINRISTLITKKFRKKHLKID